MKILEYLFNTNSISITKDEPFWYTSGKFGPFYINTHYLYGGEKEANSLLKKIDEIKNDRENCFSILKDIIMSNYEKNQIFKDTIDILIEDIKNNVDVDDYEYISGGERRDWIFSIPVAEILNIDHLTLFKDNTVYLEGTKVTDLKNKKVLHICDLINTASSYSRNWIPAIRDVNGIMDKTYCIVDRIQGGKEVLINDNVELLSLMNFDKETFFKIYSLKYINEMQYNMIFNYLENPDKFMLEYVKINDCFLLNSSKKDIKTKKRVDIFKEKYLV